MWPPNPETLKRPVYRSLAESLINAIKSGEVQQGDRLPTHRDLAETLGISVQTVSRAYEELYRLGAIAGMVGRGTFVRAAATDTRTPWHRIGDGDEVVDFSMLTPVTGEIHQERMRATLAQMSRDLSSDVLFSFRPRATLLSHAEAALGWLKRCGVEAKHAQVLPTNGNTSAMTVALMTAAKPGDLVVSEDLTHHTLKALCSYLELGLRGLETDEEGIVPDAFDSACRSHKVRALFVMPTGLNPQATTMGLARRHALIEVARRHDVTIVEDDAWGPIQPRRPPPIFALAPERTFYFTSLTKPLLPGLRYGWLVSPETLVSATANRHLVTNWMATPLMAEIGTHWLKDGTADELLAWQMDALSRRNRVVIEALGAFSPRSSPNGMHVWLPLPEQWDEDAFVAHARGEGVAVAAGSAFAVGLPTHAPGIRICLGCSSEAGMARGLEVIGRLVRNKPEPALLTI
jgi:DNA-binding transcriptional MocR family regulator